MTLKISANLVIMDILEKISQNKTFSFSIELIPPRRGMNLDNLLTIIEQLLPYNPMWVDVTSHSADIDYLETPDGTYQKRVWRKSPGTFGICAALKFKYGIESVPHMLCTGFSREETEDVLIDLNFLGIHTLVALRGDHKHDRPLSKDKTANIYASDLLAQIMAMNKGTYLRGNGAPTNFKVAVACYPEKHVESPNLNFDLKQLKRKQDLGASYAVSQMFFDNNYFYQFCEKAKANSVTIPIIPGLKIINTHKHIVSLPKSFGTTIPEELTRLFDDPTANAKELGIEWAFKQCKDLYNNGHRHIHFYVMQSASSLLTLLERMQKYCL
ncbi:MAG: methylenetetrahydrofolate reductase [Oligoflexia bacterium]|nr:methylenetetrahydrofolate reductase [Oligoflexia bacterium]